MLRHVAPESSRERGRKSSYGSFLSTFTGRHGPGRLELLDPPPVAPLVAPELARARERKTRAVERSQAVVLLGFRWRLFQGVAWLREQRDDGEQSHRLARHRYVLVIFEWCCCGLSLAAALREMRSALRCRPLAVHAAIARERAAAAQLYAADLLAACWSMLVSYRSLANYRPRSELHARLLGTTANFCAIRGLITATGCAGNLERSAGSLQHITNTPCSH